MRKVALGLLLVSMVAGRAMCADSLDKKVEKKLEKLVTSVQQGCKTELASFCKDVTPGEGRVLACLYAFEDKLSGQCEYALYDAAAQLQQAVTKIVYVANECSDDIDKYCSDIAPGELRIVKCLQKNQKTLNDRCSQALKDTLPK